MYTSLAQIFGPIRPGYLGSAGKYGESGPGMANFIANMINTIYIIGGLAFFIYLALGGLKYLTASGDPKQIQEANKQLTTAITGLVIIVASYGITSILGSILGINIFKPTFNAPTP